jgi:hypothetical protein
VHAKQLAAGESIFGKEEGSAAQLTGVILHASDISNPCRKWDVCKQHSAQIMEEFFRQGDKERSLGMPISPGLYDRGAVNIPKSQIGFIEFVVAPLMAVLCRLFPELRPTIGVNVMENREKWAEVYLGGLDEAVNAEERPGLEARMVKLREKFPDHHAEEHTQKPTRRSSIIGR